LPQKILGQTYEKLTTRSGLGISEENLTLNLRKTFDQCSIRSFRSSDPQIRFHLYIYPQITRYNIRTSADPHIRILPPAFTCTLYRAFRSSGVCIFCLLPNIQAF